MALDLPRPREVFWVVFAGPMPVYFFPEAVFESMPLFEDGWCLMLESPRLFFELELTGIALCCRFLTELDVGSLWSWSMA